MRSSQVRDNGRILIKLSGEVLKGGSYTGLDASVLKRVVSDIQELLQAGYQVALMVGGGNFWRGAHGLPIINRVSGDQMGMLATVINGVALKSAFDQEGISSVILSGIEVPKVCDAFTQRGAHHAFSNGSVVIAVGGMGEPYFTTDTGAIVRGIEMGCRVVLKATSVDGVYSEDPKQVPDAMHFPHISHEDVVAKKLRVMDLSALLLAQENNLPIKVFSYRTTGNSFLKAVEGTIRHTLISTE